MPLWSPEARCGTTLDGKYRIEQIIGQGGMGVVYRGVHLWTGRPVALKLLQPGLAADEASVTRFLNEARAAAALRHPNVVDVLDMGRCEEGAPYLALELLDGETLDTILKRGPAPLPLLFDTLLPVMHALACAHRAGIVHRDVKPANILVQYDRKGRAYPKLLDFGVAKLADADSFATRSGALVGSPYYMSPEQAAARREVTAPSDIFSCGAVWYHALSGQPPFRDESPTLVLVQIITGRAAPLSRVAPQLPPQLASAVDRALAPDPAQRFGSMLEFAQTMREVGEALGLTLRFDSMLPPAAGVPRPHLSAPALAVASQAREAARPRRPSGLATAILLSLAVASVWGGAQPRTSDADGGPEDLEGETWRPSQAQLAHTRSKRALRFIAAQSLPTESAANADLEPADKPREVSARSGSRRAQLPAPRSQSKRRVTPHTPTPRTARSDKTAGARTASGLAAFGLTPQRGAAPEPSGGL